MDPVSRRLVNVSVSIQLEFYYHEYDWGLIYREIGGGDNSKFYKVNKTSASQRHSFLISLIDCRQNIT